MPSGTTLERLRRARPTISVGVLTADLLRLGEEVALIEEAGVEVVHFDVMDGCFVPAVTFGPPLVAAVRTSLVKDVHLMIDEPVRSVREYVAAGADIVTVHPEACSQPHEVLRLLGTLENANDPGRGIVRGAALNPGTPLQVLEPLLPELELVLVLAVNPGYGGQRFIEATGGRVARVREMAAAAGRDVLVTVDGGVKRENVARIADLGADLVVTGSAVFDGRDAAGNARHMIDAVRTAAAGP